MITLAEYKNNVVLESKDIIKIGIDICNDITNMYNMRLPYKSVNMDNIILDDTGFFKLTDNFENSPMSKNPDGTENINMPEYMSPEVYLGARVDILAEIYSLGMVLYRLLNNGKAPFTGDETISVTEELLKTANERRINGEMLPLPIQCSNVELITVIMKACDYYPEKRWQNLYEFAKALDNCIKENNIVHLQNTNQQQNVNLEQNANQQQIVEQGSVNNITNSDEMENSNYSSEYTYDDTMESDSSNNKIVYVIAAVFSVLILCTIIVGVWFTIKQNENKKKDKVDNSQISVTDNLNTNEDISTDTTTQENTETEIAYIPVCYNRHIDDVSNELDLLGIKYEIEYVNDDNYEKDFVISQDYPEGTAVYTNDIVKLVVSSGKVPCPEEYEQKITVSNKAGSSQAILRLYVWENGEWAEKFSCNAKVGKNGISTNYGEGMSVTPQGKFKLGVILADKELNSNMPYEIVTATTCVVDDINSPLYNIICDSSTVPEGTSIDNIGNNIVSGKMRGAIFIEHNGNGYSSENVVPGNASVITICGVEYTPVETLGCIDITSENFIKLIELLDVEKNPYIEIFSE